MITNDFKGIMFGRKSVKVYDETVKISPARSVGQAVVEALQA
ncbi:hypothetical protein [Streptococcus sp. HF-1907]|nr:hypothetical protein [Streptococcus sp. HF-1907]